MAKILLKVDDAAEMLSIGRTLAYELIRTGEIPSMVLGTRLRVPQEELQEMVRERVAAAVAERARVLASFGKVKA